MYFLCYFCCEKKLDYSSVECRVIVLPVIDVSSTFSVQKIFDEVNCIVTPVECRVIKKSITLTV